MRLSHVWGSGIPETTFALVAGGNKDPRLSQSAILHHMEDHLPLEHGVGSEHMLQVCFVSHFEVVFLLFCYFHFLCFNTCPNDPDVILLDTTITYETTY